VALAPLYVGLVSSWGFDLEDVDVEVHLWLGEADEMASPAQMRKVASRIPRHVVTVWEGAGHFAIVERMAAILAEM
jgi:pimeloyl-ACP methyl ester carboxylesterase